jgi:MFS family permease
MLKNTQYVLNMQMAGLLLGGIFWGIIGDKLGRKSTFRVYSYLFFI